MGPLVARIVARFSGNTICRYRGHRRVSKGNRIVAGGDRHGHRNSPGRAQVFPCPTPTSSSLGFRKSQIDRLIELIERHIAEGRYPGCQIALARHGKLALYKSFGNAVTEPAKRAAAGRHAVAALLEHQGRDRGGAVGAGRARPVLLLRPDRRPRAGVQEARQGQHHGAADHHAPGGLPQRRRRQGRVDRPQAAARGGVRLPARVHAGLEGALSRPDRALDARRADRGGDRQGLPRRHPRDRHRAARACRASCMSACPRASSAAPPTCTSRSRRRATASSPAPTPTPPTGARPARRAAGLRHGARDGRALPDDAERRRAQRHAHSCRRACCNTPSATTPATGSTSSWACRCIAASGPTCAARPRTSAASAASPSPRVFGHGGVGTSYCWGDPDSGVSFAYITNNRIPDPWHSKRLDLVANFVHSAIL